jgi:hypothetical protein
MVAMRSYKKPTWAKRMDADDEHCSARCGVSVGTLGWSQWTSAFSER